MLETLLRTVLVDSPSCAAICPFDRPRATSSRISRSRAVARGTRPPRWPAPRPRRSRPSAARSPGRTRTALGDRAQRPQQLRLPRALDEVAAGTRRTAAKTDSSSSCIVRTSTAMWGRPRRSRASPRSRCGRACAGPSAPRRVAGRARRRPPRRRRRPRHHRHAVEGRHERSRPARNGRVVGDQEPIACVPADSSPAEPVAMAGAYAWHTARATESAGHGPAAVNRISTAARAIAAMAIQRPRRSCWTARTPSTTAATASGMPIQ